MSEHSKGGKQIGTRLLQLEFGERTPVFKRVNSKGRVFGSWYLRIRPRIGGFMFRLRELNQPLEHFDERLWLDTIENVTIHRDGDLTLKFWNGSEVTV